MKVDLIFRDLLYIRTYIIVRILQHMPDMRSSFVHKKCHGIIASLTCYINYVVTNTVKHVLALINTFIPVMMRGIHI